MVKYAMTLLCGVGFFFFPTLAVAIAPPRVIAERNLKADFIAIGEVIRMHTGDTPAYMILKVVHMIKGFGELNPGDQVKVLISSQPSKNEKRIVPHTQGILPVKVEEDALVIVYIERSKSHTGYFVPLLGGSSVVTVGKPL